MSGSMLGKTQHAVLRPPGEILGGFCVLRTVPSDPRPEARRPPTRLANQHRLIGPSLDSRCNYADQGRKYGQTMPDVRTPVEVSCDLVCSADEFHKIVDDIVTDAMSDCPGLTREYLRMSVLQAMLLMAVPAGSC